MTHDDLHARIATVVARVARRGDLGADAGDKDLYRDLGVKSTAALDLLLSLEEEFAVSIPDQAFGDARTVGSLVTLIGDLT